MSGGRSPAHPLRTGDNRQAPGRHRGLPSRNCFNVAHGLQRLNTIIDAYEGFLDRVCAQTTSASNSCWNARRRNPTSAQTSTRAELDDPSRSPGIALSLDSPVR